MTRDEIRAVVISHTQRRDKADVVDAAIQLALTEISLIHEWRGLRVEHVKEIAQDEPFITLDAASFQVIEARVHDGDYWYPLEIRSKTYVTTKYPSESGFQRSRPVIAYEDLGRLYVLPYPERQYEIKINSFQLHPTISATGEPIVRALDSAIIAWATAEVFRGIEKFTEAQHWLQEYGRRLQIALAAERRTHFQKVASAVDEPSPQHLVEPWRSPFMKGWR